MKKTILVHRNVVNAGCVSICGFPIELGTVNGKTFHHVETTEELLPYVKNAYGVAFRTVQTGERVYPNMGQFLR